jgi:DeoR/GlpR family transcriptional regulator of sugar metabolism
MFEHKRRSDILEKIRKNDFVSVEELAQEQGVSQMTIRRDLSWLSENGLVERCHGGASLKREVPYRKKKILNAEIKEKIAQEAVSLIERNDTVFLDAGTTTYRIAEKIVNRSDLTVVTVDLEIAYLLKDSQVSLLVCGGEVQHQTGCMLGYFADKMISCLNFNTSFIGTACVDSDFYTSTPTEKKVELKSKILEQSGRAYLVADDSKFGKSALIKINSLASFTGVISNISITDEQRKNLQKQGITMISAK